MCYVRMITGIVLDFDAYRAVVRLNTSDSVRYDPVTAVSGRVDIYSIKSDTMHWVYPIQISLNEIAWV